MKILLVQVDGKMPNLALMKISSFYKSRGHETGFAFAKPDKVYVSCIFSKNLPHAKGIKHYYPDAEFQIGGPGLEEPNNLPAKMEYVVPDYSLYPDMDYSLGFTTRGCIRNCPFCMVPRIEGYIREHKHPEIFHNPDYDKVVLMDNNFLATKKWREKLEWVEEQGLKVSFNQGLDARLIDEEKAQALADIKAYNLHFNSPTYYLAWDLMEAEQEVLQGIQQLIDAGVKPYQLMIYTLVGFNTTHNEDYYRFKKLDEMGCDPYVMIYNNRRDDEWIRHFARYVNSPKRLYRKYGLSEYKPYDLTNTLVDLNEILLP